METSIRSAESARAVPQARPANRWRSVLAVVALVSAALLLGYQGLIAVRLTRAEAGLYTVNSTWVLASFAAAIAVAGLWMLLAPAAAVRLTVWVSAAVAAVLVGTVLRLSAQIVDFGAAAATLGACWWMGSLVLRRVTQARLGSTPGAAVALGYTLLATVLTLLGFAGALQWWTVGMAVVLMAILGVRDGWRLGGGEALRRALDWRSGPTSVSAIDRLRSFSALAIAVTAVFGAVWTAAPEIQFDALHYKEWLPAIWADAGRIELPLEHPTGMMFGSTYVVPIPGHTLGGDGTGRWLQYLIGLVLCSVIWRATKVRWAGAFAAFAVVAFISSPQVIWQMSTAYDDLILTLLVVALALAIVEAERSSAQAAALIGVLAGGAISAKSHLAVFAAVAALAWTLRRPLRTSAGRLAWMAAGAVLVVAPLAIARWIATGNPVFPILNNVFKSRYFPEINPSFNLPFGEGSWGDLLQLPIQLVAEPGGRFMEIGPPGSLGFLVIPALLAPAAALLGGRRTRILAIAYALAYLVWWHQLRYLRYMLPYAVTGLILLAYAMHIPRSVRDRARTLRFILIPVASVALIVSFPSTMAMFWNIPERFPSRVVLQEESVPDYLDRTLPGTIDIARAIDDYGQPGDHVIGSTAYARTHITPGIETSAEWEFGLRRSLRWPEASDDPDEVLRRWREFGATMIAADVRTRVAGYGAEEALLLASRADLIWADNSQELYRLVDEPAPLATHQLCDPSFAGDGACWGTQLDGVPGLAATESPHAASQSFEACPGSTYIVRVDADGADGGTILTVATMTADGHTDDWQQATIPAGRPDYVAQTASPEAAMVIINVAPQGDAVVHDAQVDVVLASGCE